LELMLDASHSGAVLYDQRAVHSLHFHDPLKLQLPLPPLLLFELPHNNVHIQCMPVQQQLTCLPPAAHPAS
jgi:hypothetical protein